MCAPERIISMGLNPTDINPDVLCSASVLVAPDLLSSSSQTQVIHQVSLRAADLCSGTSVNPRRVLALRCAMDPRLQPLLPSGPLRDTAVGSTRMSCAPRQRRSHTIMFMSIIASFDLTCNQRKEAPPPPNNPLHGVERGDVGVLAQPAPSSLLARCRCCCYGDTRSSR